MALLWSFVGVQALAVPVISDFSPNGGAPGTSVVIVGSDLAGTREVRFGPALAIFVVENNSRIFATVPLDAISGPITIGSASGTAGSARPFIVAPRITDFSPGSGPTNSQVLITGFNFEGTTSVRFNGTNPASFFVTAPTQIRATVPFGATNGPISVTTPAGTGQSTNPFVVTGNGPFISSFAPTNGVPGTVVTVTGGNFTGATAVRFNGTNAPAFSVTSPTQIRVTVPVSASSGPISVVGPLGTGTSSDRFVLSSAPIIDDFSPVGGPAGTDVVINGQNFAGATAVKFGGKNAANVSITAASQLHATVPAGATNGPISITTPQGTGVSQDEFFASPGPIVTEFNPVLARAGEIVVLNGLNFNGVRTLQFGGANAQFSVVAATQINAVVPGNATNGPIRVITTTGTNATSAPFFLRTGKPIFITIVPEAGPPRTPVLIEGFDLATVTSVKFNGVEAAFNVVSDTQLNTLVPDHATTGPISLSNQAGTVLSPVRFVVAPRISSFSPTSGVTGTNVTIRGTNFSDVLAVKFNGTSASYTNRTTNEIVAVVPLEATSGSVSVTTAGGIVASTNSFLVLPRIASFAPSGGPAGTQVTISGSGFGGLTAVTFGGASTTALSSQSSTQIVAIVPARAVTGPITVTTTSGAGASTSPFSVGTTADLSVSQIESADPVLESQVLTYSVTVTNHGPSAATQVVMTDTVDPLVVVRTATATSGSVTRTLTGTRVDIANLPSGASSTLTLSVLTLLNGTITNRVTVSALENDANTADNTSVETTAVQVSPAELSLEDAAPNQIRLSWPVSATNFVLQVSNRIAPAPQWQNVNLPPVVSGNRKIVTIAVGTGTSFYRLASP